MVVVLLAEDDEDIAVALTRLFSRSGMTVMHAPDGAAALVLATGQRPDVVMTDIGMPVMDGWALIRELRSDSALSEVPVIVLSGQLHPGQTHTPERSICAALLKPCPNERLLAVVQHLAAAGPHPHPEDGLQPPCPAATLVGA